MNHVNAIHCNDEYQCSHCGKSWDIHEEAPDCKMTLVNTAGYKTVDYFGQKLTVNENYNWLATDSDGFVYAYIAKPLTDNDGWYTNMSQFTHCATVNLHGLDWKETLRKC